MSRDAVDMRVDFSGLVGLIRKVEDRLGATQVKRGLTPAAKIIRKGVESEARVGTGYSSRPGRPQPGRIRKSVKVRRVRNKPILLVAVAREAALSRSKKYPRFPYVNWIVGDKKTALGDKFVQRGTVKVLAKATTAAIDGLLTILRSTGRIR